MTEDRPNHGWVHARKVKAGLAVLAAIAILGGYAAAREHFGPSSAERVFLLFHTLAELFSIVVACGIFVIAWNCRKILDNNYLLFLGISWLFAAVLDVAHLMAYRGMNIFAGYGLDLPTELWISMRYVQAVSLLLAPLFLGRNLPVGKMAAVYAVVTAALLAACFTDVFPDCFIDSGDGSHSGRLTVFKIASEYAIASIMLGALLLLARRRQQFDPQILRRLEGAILALIASGMAFTLYKRSDDLMNMAGHLLQLGAFVLIYKAIIVTGLVRPRELLFHNLKLSEEAYRQSERRYRTLVELAPLAIVIHRRGKILYMNEAGLKLLGEGDAYQVIGHDIWEWALSDDVMTMQERAAMIVEEGQSLSVRETRFRRKDGGAVDVESMIRGIMYEGQVSALHVFQDITQRKQARIERERLVDALNKVRQALELRVQEQTADLEQAVETLQAEVEARFAVEAERRRLEAEVLKTSEMERQSIGYDLHDGLGQSLTGTAFLSAMLHRKLAARSLPEAADAAEIERLIMQSVQVARSLARGLSPVGLAGENLCKGLDDLAAMIEEMYGIACVFKPGANVAVHDRSAATHLYRIAQEAANNACKHGRARHIEIRLSSDESGTRLCVEDDGAGLPEKIDGQKGMGLRIMHYRANTIGATLEVRRRSQGGTAVQCVLPRPGTASKLETGNG